MVNPNKETNEEVIKRVYYDPETGYGSQQKLHQRLKKAGYTITPKEIKEVLSNQEVVQVNQKNSGKQNSFVAPYAKYEYQVDIIYLENKHLNQASYGLTCIDIFSKVGDIELMKKRDTPNVLIAIAKILNRMGTPENIYSDEGSEFISNKYKEFMKDLNVNLILTLNHAPFIERFNRSFKDMLEKYLQATNSKTITNVLPKILNNYNSSIHSGLPDNMSPNDVNEDNEGNVWIHQNKHANMKPHDKVEKGDTVRVRLKSKSFEKGYKPKYSKQIYKVIKSDGTYYTIEGLDRKYLRAFIKKIEGTPEAPDIKADLKGTQEGRNKALAKIPFEKKAVTRAAATIPTERRSSRIRKKTEILDL